MARLRIPERVRLGFETLASLSDTAVAELLSALEEIKPMASIEKLAGRLSAKTPSISKKQLDDIIVAIASLNSGPTDTATCASRFLEDVLDSLYDSKSPPSMPRDELSLRLLPLSNVESVAVSGRAAALLSDHARTMIDARVLSDIRPVFAPDNPADLRGSVLVHTLKISFIEAGRPHDFFVALDTPDLTNLIEILERAQAKAARLGELSDALQLPIFEVE